MLRGTFHYSFTPKFDTYGGVGIGVRHTSYSYEGSSSIISIDNSTGAASGLFVGGRYYFAPNFGVFSELGYDQSFIKLGISAKF